MIRTGSIRASAGGIATSVVMSSTENVEGGAGGGGVEGVGGGVVSGVVFSDMMAGGCDWLEW